MTTPFSRLRRAHTLAVICEHIAIVQRHLAAQDSDIGRDIKSCASVLQAEIDELRRYCDASGIDWRAGQTVTTIETHEADGGKFQPPGTG